MGNIGEGGRTMLKTRPQFTSRQLQGPPPGDVGLLIHVNGQVAIVAVLAKDPYRHVIAAFDPAANAFTHRIYNGETALIFSGELIFEPDLSKPIAEASPKLAAGSDVFFDGN